MATHAPRLPSYGYIVVSLELKPGVIEAALVQAQPQPNLRTYTPVFHTVGGPDDPNRLQSRVECRSAAMREIHLAVQEVTSISKAGGSMQALHQDYTTEYTTIETVPGSAIIVLEAGTSLRVFQECFNEIYNRAEKIVEIPQGYCMILRGYLIHSGVGYQQQNLRLHCYLAVGDKTWEPDVVNSARAPGTSCEHYHSFEDEDAAKVHQHRYTCESNRAAKANKEKRRKREQGVIYTCDICYKVEDDVRVYKTYESGAAGANTSVISTLYTL